MCTQRRLRSAWASAQSSMSAWRKLGPSATHWVHSEDSDQTGRMPRLIWVFAGRTVIVLVLSWCGSFTFQHGTNATDPKFYFWDIETDSLSYFNFETGKGEQDDYPPEQMEGMTQGSAIEMSDADRWVWSVCFSFCLSEQIDIQLEGMT